MRPIHVARLDKVRPVLILTRELVRPHLTTVTIAPITTTIRGLSTEVPVNAAAPRWLAATTSPRSPPRHWASRSACYSITKSRRSATRSAPPSISTDTVTRRTTHQCVCTASFPKPTSLRGGAVFRWENLARKPWVGGWWRHLPGLIWRRASPRWGRVAAPGAGSVAGVRQRAGSRAVLGG
jgi:hypothetical protein